MKNNLRNRNVKTLGDGCWAFMHKSLAHFGLRNFKCRGIEDAGLTPMGWLNPPDPPETSRRLQDLGSQRARPEDDSGVRCLCCRTGSLRERNEKPLGHGWATPRGFGCRRR